MTEAPSSAPSSPRSFAAMRHSGFRAQFITYVLSMMADNIEHVISYWVVFQKFHSPALGGFAVLSHWLPFLLFSVASGALAERFDPRRVIQVGMGLFILASLAWGYFFITDTLQMWQAMLILVIHGCAGVLWQTPNQMLIYDIVGPQDLASAVRLNAMARYTGILVGPAVGGAILLALGPAHGIMLNTVFYLPLVLWLIKAPYGPRFRKGTPPPRRAVRGLADIVNTMRDVRQHTVIVAMTVLAGAASFFVGNAYSSQMPGFAAELGHGDPGVSYSMLLAADAAGGLLAGLALEGRNILPPRPRTAIILALLWCVALTVFALSHSYALALCFLLVAGFLELSFNAMAQSLVQINAPPDMRGRVIGLFNMASLGLRAFSGISVGLLGSLIGIHWSLALSAMATMIVAGGLLAVQ
ncbi:MFS transporter [Afipia sp. GAS231]|uniref:MFS transporter n=1 Tax=Afipia sp. GAS231 TaxID=1882747 RepID=UPI00087C3C94|nr:MFS transporter [Afipia sp. GAS231]SDP20192.1 MFS-type transporter involved in bile tolerance, Atg22 family [Afipia sp. GAS231]